MLKLDKLYANGYTATFIDTSTGFGTTVSDIGVSACDGIASVYSNNQGFVEELRVIVVDHDREFAIIVPAGQAQTPDLDTVIITNPETVKPGDKVD